jgi:hypothetical protein
LAIVDRLEYVEYIAHPGARLSRADFPRRQPDTELLEAFCDNHEKTMEHRQVTRAADLPSPPLR